MENIKGKKEILRDIREEHRKQVVLEELKNGLTVVEICRKYKASSTLISRLKSELIKEGNWKENKKMPSKKQDNDKERTIFSEGR